MSRKRHEEQENHERWLVSYADFITLLFAFFVVMYAVSSLNEGKYKVLSDALVGAFGQPTKSLDPVQVGEPSTSAWVDKGQRSKSSRPIVAPVPVDYNDQNTNGQRALDQIADNIQEKMAPLIDKDLISIKRDKDWLEVEIRTSILFPSGSAAMETEAQPVLKDLAGIFQDFPNLIQIEGFTDNVPINTMAYPSNWELSAARAASVVRLFSRSGVKPERMAVVAYGEFRPVAENGTPEGRNRNRRVVLHVLAQSDIQRAQIQPTN